MYVNPFWFGILMAFVGMIAIAILIALINTIRGKDEDEYMEPVGVAMTEDQFRDAIIQAIREAAVEALKESRCTFGGMVEDNDGEEKS